jgi:hypothetical protein
MRVQVRRGIRERTENDDFAVAGIDRMIDFVINNLL